MPHHDKLQPPHFPGGPRHPIASSRQDVYGQRGGAQVQRVASQRGLVAAGVAAGVQQAARAARHTDAVRALDGERVAEAGGEGVGALHRGAAAPGVDVRACGPEAAGHVLLQVRVDGEASLAGLVLSHQRGVGRAVQVDALGEGGPGGWGRR